MSGLPVVSDDVYIKLAEYEQAQDMLKHYDSLNWRIGSILLSANAVLLGLVANVLPKLGLWGILVSVCVAGFSFVLLSRWCQTYDRNRSLYNLRNETLHRLETQLGMFHFLRAVEADKRADGRAAPPWTNVEQEVLGAKKRAYRYAGTEFRALYDVVMDGTSTHELAMSLATWVPLSELAVLLSIVVAVNA